MMQRSPLNPTHLAFEENELVCHCFGYTRTAIEQDYRRQGRSTMLERIILEQKKGGCNCIRNNPKGR